MALTRLNNRSITAVTALPSGITMPAGSVVQVKSTEDKGAYVWSAQSDYVDAGNLSVTITPKSSTNKIFLMLTINICHPDSDTGHVRVMRNSTQIACGNADIGSWPATTFSSRIYSHNNNGDNYNVFAYSMQFLDAPATTSSLTYKIQFWPRSSQPMSLNRSLFSTTSDLNMGRQTSTISVMEIAV